MNDFEEFIKTEKDELKNDTVLNEYKNPSPSSLCSIPLNPLTRGNILDFNTLTKENIYVLNVQFYPIHNLINL